MKGLNEESSTGNAMVKLPDEAICFTDVIDDVERTLIVQALRKAGGNRTQAGSMLCLTRQTLNYKIKKLNIQIDCQRRKRRMP